MEKNSRIQQVYGVLGYPAKHSLSPLMHNAAFNALKLNAQYLIFEKKPEELASFLHTLSEENIFGLNVTVPHKEKVIPFLSMLSQEAELIGAVNTIRVSDGKLEGFNTDGAGFLKHITQDLRFDPAGKRIAMIGAGGAAKAVAVYLSIAGVKGIAICDIDKVKLSALAAHLKANFKKINIETAHSVKELNLGESDVLINATAVGMKKDDPCLVEEKLIHKDLLVYDLIYNPPKTKLLEVAQEKKARISNGLGMLLYQGMSAFEIWTGQKAPKEIMHQALLKALAPREKT